MSEQLVDKLLKQSRTEYWTQYTPSYDYEKFAELIVQECLMKAIGAKIRGESIDTLIQNIKEDFGVE